MKFFRKIGNGIKIGCKCTAAVITYPLFLRRLRKQKADDEVIITLFPHQGDVFYGMLYAEQFKRETGKKICVYCCETLVNMVKKYSCVDRMIVYSKKSIAPYSVIFFSTMRYKFGRKDNYDGIIATVPPRDCFRGRAATEVYRDRIYKIKSDNKGLYIPDFAPIKSIPDFEANKDKIVVLNPYSFSHGYNRKLFEAIVVELKNMGYIVYTNAVPKFGQEVIKGSLRLDCSVEELYAIVQQIPIFLSVRSGIVDVMVSGQGNLFVLYIKKSWMRQYYAIRDLNPKINTEEAVWLNKKDTPRVINRIKDFLSKTKA